MAVIRGNTVGVDLCNALGLDYREVMCVNIHCPADGIVTVAVAKNVRSDELPGVVSVLSRYELHDKESD